MENQLIHSNEMGLRVGDAYQIEPSDFENDSSDMKDLHDRIKTEPLDEFEAIGTHGENGLCELMSEQHGLTSDPNEAMDTQRMHMKIEPQDHATFLDHDTLQYMYLRENSVWVKSEPVSNEEQIDSSDETQRHDSTRFPTTSVTVTTPDNLPMPAIRLGCDIKNAEHGAENSLGSDSHYPVYSDDLIHHGAVKTEPVEAQSEYTNLTGEGAVKYGETSSQLWRVKNEGEHDTEQSAAPKSVPRCQNVGAVSDKTKSVIFLDLDKLERENTSGIAGAESDDAPIFICDDCNQSFGSYTELVQHQTAHVTDARQRSYKVKLNLTIFRCEKCGGNFFDSQSLSQHWDVCNNDECDNVFEGLYQESTSSLEDKREKETAVSGNMYVCIICEKKFSSVEALVTHRETYGHHQCRKCYTMFSGMKLIGRHVCNAGRNLIQCCSCACMFERKDAALYSEDLSDPSVPFHNGWCREESIDRDGEGLGQKCKQCSEKVFKCNKCNNAFKSYESLKRHDEKSHPNARTYNCKYCAKAFERKDSLICHEAVHKGINNAKSLQNVVVKNHKIRKRKIDNPDFSPCRARRDGKVGRSGGGCDKQRIKRAALCSADIGAHEDQGFSSEEKTGAKQTVSQSSEGVVMNGLISAHQGVKGVDSKAGTGIQRQSTSDLETWGDDSKSELNSLKGEYHVSRRTCMAVNVVNGEYCTGKYKIDLSDNERRCQKCGSKPR